MFFLISNLIFFVFNKQNFQQNMQITWYKDDKIMIIFKLCGLFRNLLEMGRIGS